jgi:predicted DNA binding protein
MVVIVRFGVAEGSFDLGEVVPTDEETTVELESLVRSGDRRAPLFWVVTPDTERFVASVEEGDGVTLTEIEAFDDRTLFELDWDLEADRLFGAIDSVDAHLLRAVGADGRWLFSIRFPTHGDLARFRRRCEEVHVHLDVLKVYHATAPTVEPGFGVTDRQREALLLAVDRGYYAIPRESDTGALAGALGISKQSVIERLRRGTVNLVRNTLGEEDR